MIRDVEGEEAELQNAKGKNVPFTSPMLHFSMARTLICKEKLYSTQFPELPCIIYRNPGTSSAQGCQMVLTAFGVMILHMRYAVFWAEKD